MRILIVTNMYPTDERPGWGIFVRDQVVALSRIPGIEVTVWNFKPGSYRYISAAIRLFKYLRSREFDVVHAHYGLSGWTALVAGRKRLVVTFHGTDLRHRLVAPLSRLLARLVKVPAVASPKLRSRLGRYGDRAAVLPTGVNLERFHPIPRSEARRQLGLEGKNRLLLFPADPGRPVKRYDRAKQLAERLPETELITLGSATPDEVALWINASDAVLVTSDEEGFGLAVCESLACNIPVLATPVGIAPLALEGIDDCLCTPFDLDRWTEAIKDLFKNEDPMIHGREQAELFETGRMAERVAMITATIFESTQQRDLQAADVQLPE